MLMVVLIFLIGVSVSSFSDTILGNANALLEASKSLDFQGIVDHNAEEVAKLRAVIERLSIQRKRSGESLEDYADKQSGPLARGAADIDDLPSLDDMDIDMGGDALSASGSGASQASRDEIIKALVAEGMDDRVGLVYNSFSDSRTLPFSQAHHRRGVPVFEVVAAPDFAPVSGMHGVFISNTEVMSIILPSDNASADWQILKRKDYSTLDEMIEYTSLISAGFDLPG